jgi:hypothetical protein
MSLRRPKLSTKEVKRLMKKTEFCTVQMNIGNELITLVSIYKPPCGNSGESAVQLI